MMTETNKQQIAERLREYSDRIGSQNKAANSLKAVSAGTIIGTVTVCQEQNSEIPTLDGKASIKIPAESQSGKIFRLRGKGIKGVRSSTHGDLHCHVIVETPVNLTERQKELLREFESINDLNSAHHNPRAKSWMNKVKDFFG